MQTRVINKKVAATYFQGEGDKENVKRSLNKITDFLDKQIKHEKIKEERRGF
ncbi:hypothetical protein KBI33_01805 [Candidatus Shapirobacteria bacterium]|nr:hypothetical protein [Candidatus Shapirobacteria bacterium]